MMKHILPALAACLILHQSALAQEKPEFPIYTEKDRNIVLSEPDFENFIGMKFVNIPKGSYRMGGCIKVRDDDEIPNAVNTNDFNYILMACPPRLQPDILATSFEGPSRRIDIDYDFQIGMFEVTIAEYTEFLTKARRLRTKDFFRTNSMYHQTPQHPVMHVSVHDAQEFARWLNKLKPESDIGIYRLPSEAEWEYAARAGTLTRYSWNSNNINCLKADYGDALCNEPGPSPVGSYKPNGFGIYDAHGNVSEWVSDCWSKDYLDAPEDGGAVTKKGCAIFLHRGGAWFMNPVFLRNSDRKPSGSKFRHDIVGFRLVRDLRGE